MLGTVLYGSLIWAFSPLAVMILGWLAWRPQLGVIAMTASFVALMPIQLTSFIFMIAAASNGESNPSQFTPAVADAAHHGRGAIVVFGVLFQELFRFLLAFGLVRAEWYFRAHHQVMVKSRYRMLPVGFAAGMGYALTLALLSFVTLIEALVQLEDETIAGTDATMFLFDSCPQIPYAAFQGISTCATTVSNVIWFAMAVQAVAAVYDAPKDFISTIESDDVISPIPKASRVMICRPTSMSRKEGFIVAAAVLVLHMLSSLVTLVNSDAYDWNALEPTPGRGCVVSLPIQWIVMGVTIAAGAALAKIEGIKKVDENDL